MQVELEMEGYQPQRSRLNLDVSEPLEPNTPHGRPFPVRNPFPPGTDPITISLGLVPHVPNWDLELSQYLIPNLAPGMIETVILTVTPPAMAISHWPSNNPRYAISTAARDVEQAV